MDSSNAERAWEAYVGRAGFWTGSDRFAFMAGRASRDAEVAELTSRLRWDVAAARVEAFTTESDTFRARGEALVKQISELRAALGDSEARRAELEATAEYLAEAIRLTQEYVGPEILPPIEGWSWYDALAKYRSLPRSVVLEDRDREVAARAVDGVASMLETGSTNPAGKYGSLNEGSRSHWFSRGLREATDRVRERAAAIRKGDTNA